MVAEVVPENRRVEAGALLYTSAPLGLFLATFVNFQIAGVFFQGTPEVLALRLPVRAAPGGGRVHRSHVRKEPERWKQAAAQRPPQPRIA